MDAFLSEIYGEYIRRCKPKTLIDLIDTIVEMMRIDRVDGNIDLDAVYQSLKTGAYIWFLEVGKDMIVAFMLDYWVVLWMLEHKLHFRYDEEELSKIYAILVDKWHNVINRIEMVEAREDGLVIKYLDDVYEIKIHD